MSILLINLAKIGQSRATRPQGHVRFALSVGQGRPALVALSQGMSILLINLAKIGQSSVARVRRLPCGISVFCFGMAKGGQPLVDLVLCFPRAMSFLRFFIGGTHAMLSRVMSVLRFGLAKAGQPLMLACHDLPGDCPLCALALQR